MRTCLLRSLGLSHGFGFLPNQSNGCTSIQPEKVGTVVHEFVNRLMHIGKSSVVLLLLERCMHRGFPSLGQLFERTYIQIAVMEECLQLGHVLDQKPSVLANGVAAHRGTTGWHVTAQKGDQLVLRLRLCGYRGFDLVNQAALAMGSLVPGIHLVQLCITLVYDQHRPFNALVQIGAGHNDGNFNDPVNFRVQSGHLAVQPDQVLVGFS